jgi:hypothetical protein
MNIKDIVCMWSEDERILKLFLFPFELSEQDIQIVLSDSIYSYWIVRDPNPELSKWYNCPYAHVRIWFDDSGHTSINATTRYYVLMRAIRARLSSDNLNKSGRESQKDLKKLSLSLHKNGSFVEVSIKGEGTIFRQRFSWDINCRSKVYIK